MIPVPSSRRHYSVDGMLRDPKSDRGRRSTNEGIARSERKLSLEEVPLCPAKLVCALQHNHLCKIDAAEYNVIRQVLQKKLEVYQSWVSQIQGASSFPLTSAEVIQVREAFLRHVKADITSPFSRQTLLKPWRSQFTIDPNCRHTRQLIRAADAIHIPRWTIMKQSVRRWFSQPAATANAHTACIRLGLSPLYIGRGPNGAYEAALNHPIARARIRSLGANRGTEGFTVLLSKEDINNPAYPERRIARDREIAGFLASMVELGVGLVVANGFTEAHDSINMIDLGIDNEPYIDFSKPAMAALLREGLGRGDGYNRGACRDFFNYFGSPDGDDGAVWEYLDSSTSVRCKLDQAPEASAGPGVVDADLLTKPAVPREFSSTLLSALTRNRTVSGTLNVQSNDRDDDDCEDCKSRCDEDDTVMTRQSSCGKPDCVRNAWLVGSGDEASDEEGAGPRANSGSPHPCYPRSADATIHPHQSKPHLPGFTLDTPSLPDILQAHLPAVGVLSIENQSRSDGVEKGDAGMSTSALFAAKDADAVATHRPRMLCLKDHGITITSSLLKRQRNRRGCKVDLYELEVECSAHLFHTPPASLTHILKVMHIHSYDMSPAELPEQAVETLLDEMLNLRPGSEGVFVHCAGGLGRTGDVAFALSDVLCDTSQHRSVLDHVKWLRSQRPGAIQTPEQLMDGVELSHTLLTALMKRIDEAHDGPSRGLNTNEPA